MHLTDTHAHLTDNRFVHDLPDVITRARNVGVTTIINVGYDLLSSRDAVRLASTFDGLYAAAGIHPHEAAGVDEQALTELRVLSETGTLVAIGEIGLDYYYNHAPREVQQKVFRQQIRLARELSLPVIIHDRDAHDDILAILREEDARSVGGVMHCFSGNKEFAGYCLDLGFYVSLAGPVTFKNAQDLPEVAKYTPADRLLLETDAPYLAPIPYRGKRNEPAYVRVIAEKVAQLRGIEVEELAALTTENAKRVFNIVK